MKYLNIIFIPIIALASFSCTDYLDVIPDNVATLEHAFRDRIGAEKFLATCYSYLPLFGHPGYDPAIGGSDEIWIHEENSVYASSARLANFHSYRLKLNQQNVSNPLLNFWDGNYNGKNLFIGIRDCNIFLENIHKVGKDLQEWERERWIAEVKFLKAYYHYYLLRMYGPIPIIRENLDVSAGVSEVRVFREPFDECVNYIVNVLDEAIPDLPLKINSKITELGRITQPIALAIKAELLVTSASPLFNGNSTYSNFVDSKGTKLFNSVYDESKWKIAMEACQEAIDKSLEAGHHLYEFNDYRYQLSNETRQVMSARNVFGERWNEEIIWGISKNTTTPLQELALPYFENRNIQNFTSNPILSAPIHIAEMFYSENGVPISEDKFYDYENRYETSIAIDQDYFVVDGFETAKLNQHREARFYANLGFDGGIWFGNGRYQDVGMGEPSETSWAMAMKLGQVSGKTQTLRYSMTGYFPKKYTHFETEATTQRIDKRMAFPLIRLADLFLLYAEARNEYLGPDAEVYKYLDLVRERAGLKGVVASWEEFSKYPDRPRIKEELRKIIQHERMIELAFEGKRFWDIRRWKTAERVLNQPVKGWNIQGSTADEYYNIVPFKDLIFQTKEYLWPLRQQTIRVNPNLTQNPFWVN